MDDTGKPYPLPSGAVLLVTVANWGETKALHDALARAINGSGVTSLEAAAFLKAMQARAEESPLASDAPDPAAAADKMEILSVLARKALEVSSSKELERAIFACAEKAVYQPNGQIIAAIQFKLDAPGYGVFDNPKCREGARKDYYAICAAVVEENLAPFGEALFSVFSEHAEKRATSPA